MKNINPFEQERTSFTKEQRTNNKSIESALQEAIKAITVLIADKELRLILAFIIGCVIITGIVYNILWAIDYWQFSIGIISVISWRIYVKYKKYFNKK